MIKAHSMLFSLCVCVCVCVCVSTDTPNGVFGTGDKPFRVGHSPAASPCYLEHSTPTRRGNVVGAVGGIADVILES